MGVFDTMVGVLKKVFVLLVVGFAVYYLLTTPADAADCREQLRSAGSWTPSSQVGVFFNELVN